MIAIQKSYKDALTLLYIDDGPCGTNEKDPERGVGVVREKECRLRRFLREIRGYWRTYANRRQTAAVDDDNQERRQFGKRRGYSGHIS